MKERPILFSAPMVRAILAGTKTQTRRVLRDGTWWTPKHGVIRMAPAGLACTGFAVVSCPYGVPGDRLWVREAWRVSNLMDGAPPRNLPPGAEVFYEATSTAREWRTTVGKLRPSMFMPRWASRITLEVASVRVERLQAISEADAIAEGVDPSRAILGSDDLMMHTVMSKLHVKAPVARYVLLWDSLNGKVPINWNSNPWVWAVEFRRVQ